MSFPKAKLRTCHSYIQSYRQKEPPVDCCFAPTEADQSILSVVKSQDSRNKSVKLLCELSMEQ